MAESLKLTDFAVIWRNLVDLGRPAKRLNIDCLSPLVKTGLINPEAETEELSVIKQVSQTVCGLGKKDLIHTELKAIAVLDQPKLRYYEDKVVLEAFNSGPVFTIQIYPVFHSSGAIIFNFHCRFTNPQGWNVEEVVELIRLNLRILAIKVPNSFLTGLPPVTPDDRIRRIEVSDKETVLIAGLKDLTTDVFRPVFHNLLESTLGVSDPRDMRCISSTLIQVYKTLPECEATRPFVEKFGREIYGVATMDRTYNARPLSFISESFANDLAPDEEIAVYTFGLSDIILFDHTIENLAKQDMEKKGYKKEYSGILYNSTHYSSLLEWVYLEKYIIDLYNHLLSRAISSETTSPEDMLELQKQSMRDLIGYREGITPYPSRAEFLEKARISHHLPEAQEKIEKKRELATEYVLQEYTLRTNHGIQLVNIFISATAVMGLMQVILEIRNGEDKMFWWILTAVIFFITLGILWGISKTLMHKKPRS